MASVKWKRSPSPSSSSTHQPKYDVFLSFRGEDTRNNFTDHLYAELKKRGIITFRDEEELKKGELISELFKAIEESQLAIIIFSKKYASSTWCLDELVKIVKCKDEMGLKVFPVFYDVSASVVRKQTGTFKKAFTAHRKRFKDNIEKVKTWRNTLKRVADISGWDLHLQNRHESEIIQDIVKEIMKKLSSKYSSINKNLIGIKSMMAELIPSYLGSRNGIYMMGICGMGGLGKTTLATAIFYEYSKHFEGCSFIADVRKKSQKGDLHLLQKQLLQEILGESTEIYNVQTGVQKIRNSGLRHKKVLLVLDDVNCEDQLENLVGECDWFGLGSWIIITSRDEHVLVNHGVLKIYKPKRLDDDDALKLFCSRAFKKKQPEEGYIQLCQKVVEYASGLPLALVTLGSLLFGRTVEEWQSALERSKNIEGDIYDVLKISYDGLNEMEKEIFLDIACFFGGWKKDEVEKILENCGFNSKICIRVLVDRSLLTIDDKGYLRMHDLLQEMGQKIVHFELGGKLGKPNRLWLIEGFLHLSENNMATEAVQAIVLHFYKNDFYFEEFLKVLSKKSNLRLMIITGGHMNVLDDQRQLFVPNQLRHLSWEHFSLKCLSSSSQPKELVHLDLKGSRIEYLWEGVMHADKLKFIDLSRSLNLIRTPDFSGVPILEELRLSECKQLVEIHPSIGQLSKLRFLFLDGCESLTNLPRMSAVMQSLTVLNLAFSKISLFPKFTGIMKSLSELKWTKTAIKEVAPSSIKCVPALTLLDLSICKSLKYFPSNMDNLKSLKTLSLSYSNLITTPDFSGVPILERLNLSCCDSLVEIHPSIVQLSRLRYLHLDNCSSLIDLPCMSAEMQSLEVLDLSHCLKISLFPKFMGIMKSLSRLILAWTAIKTVEPSSIECLTALTFLDLSCCENLECLPSNMDNMRTLKILNLSHCSKISSFPKFMGIMNSLSRLILAWTAIKTVEPSSIECLTALTFLDLRCCENLECLPSNMDNLRSLEILDLSECSKLKSFPRLPSNVRFIKVGDCSFLKWSPEGVKLSIWSQPLSQWLPYDESISQKEFTILFHYLQGILCRKAILDGFIIPSCLIHQRVGNSISIELPSNWYNSKWIGFALSASLSTFLLGSDYIRAHVVALVDMPRNHYAFKHFTTHIRGEDSVCLLYLSREDWFAKVQSGECSQIKVIFEVESSYGSIINVGPCGVSLIYKQDVNEFNQTNAQCLIKSFGKVSIYKLIVDDDDDDEVPIVRDDVHLVDDDDEVHIVRDDVHIVRDDVHIVDDDFDDGDY